MLRRRRHHAKTRVGGIARGWIGRLQKSPRHVAVVALIVEHRVLPAHVVLAGKRLSIAGRGAIQSGHPRQAKRNPAEAGFDWIMMN